MHKAKSKITQVMIDYLIFLLLAINHPDLSAKFREECQH